MASIIEAFGLYRKEQAEKRANQSCQTCLRRAGDSCEIPLPHPDTYHEDTAENAFIANYVVRKNAQRAGQSEEDFREYLSSNAIGQREILEKALGMKVTPNNRHAAIHGTRAANINHDCPFHRQAKPELMDRMRFFVEDLVGFTSNIKISLG